MYVCTYICVQTDTHAQKFIQEFNWSCPSQGIKLISEPICRLSNKKPQTFLSSIIGQGCPREPKTRATDTALERPSELDCKALLLKTAHTLVIGY